MTIEGIDYIDMMLVSETGNGASNQKNFTVSEHNTIEWVGGGTPIVALERPDLSIARGEPLDGSRYTLHFTINTKQNLQSHRNSGLDGPMGVVSVSLLDDQSKVLLDMPRYSLFEFWCGENNVERWHPEKNDPDLGIQEDHEVWRHSIQKSFDSVSSARISFANDTAHWKTCG